MNNISILHFSLDLDKKGNYSNIIGQTSGCDKHVLKLCFLLLMMFNFKFDCQDSSWEPVNSKSCLFRVECYSIFLIIPVRSKLHVYILSFDLWLYSCFTVMLLLRKLATLAFYPTVSASTKNLIQCQNTHIHSLYGKQIESEKKHAFYWWDIWANKSYVLKISVLLERRGSKLKINK